MKQLITQCFLLLAVLVSSGFTCADVTTQADDIVGEWYLSDKSGIVSVYERDGLYFSKSFKMIDPLGPDEKPPKDVKNPDPNKRNRLLEDVEFLYDFKFDGTEEWYGEIYNTEDGRTYSGKIYLENPNTLVLRGYIGSPLFGRSVTWTRYR